LNLKVGEQPLNLQAGYYYHVERPDDASRQQVLLLMFLFRK